MGYQGILNITYLDSLLNMVSKEFVSKIGDGFGNGLNIKHVDFGTTFMDCRRKVDKEALEARRGTGNESFDQTKRGQAVAQKREEKGLPTSSNSKPKAGNKGNDEEDEEGDPKDKDKVATARAKLLARAKGSK